MTRAHTHTPPSARPSPAAAATPPPPAVPPHRRTAASLRLLSSPPPMSLLPRPGSAFPSPFFPRPTFPPRTGSSATLPSLELPPHLGIPPVTWRVSEGRLWRQADRLFRTPGRANLPRASPTPIPSPTLDFPPGRPPNAGLSGDTAPFCPLYTRDFIQSHSQRRPIYVPMIAEFRFQTKTPTSSSPV